MPPPHSQAPQSEVAQSRALAELSLHPNAAVVPEMSREQYAQFIAEIVRDGVTVPLEITAEGVVLDGRQRLRAAHELGLASVPVQIVDVSDEVEHMLLRALARRHLTESQRAALVVDLKHWRERAVEAKARSNANLRRGMELPEVATLPPRGRTRELIAASVGVSARTVQEALTVRRHDPELFERVKAGDVKVHTAARRVRRTLRDAALPPVPLMPTGPFDLVYADPAWQLGHPDGAHSPENHYPTLPLEEIKALRVPAAEDAVLFLWAVNMLMPQALEVMVAWGFSYKAQLVWVKESPALGNWVRNQHELLLIGRKGKFPTPDPEDRPGSVIQAKRGRHSEKPACVYELIERMYPHASKLELFARGTSRAGWVAWGNEAEQDEAEADR